MKYSKLPVNQRNALNVFVKLMRASNTVNTRIHGHLKEDNLTVSQFGVLEALYHLGPLSQSELGIKILKSNANLTTVVDSLEKKTWWCGTETVRIDEKSQYTSQNRVWS